MLFPYADIRMLHNKYLDLNKLEWVISISIKQNAMLSEFFS